MDSAQDEGQNEPHDSAPHPKKRRCYEMEGGKWKKVEDNPNNIEHKPLKGGRQFSLWDVAVSVPVAHSKS